MAVTKTLSVRQRFRGWLRLLRVPNLFTVPGDPIAGMVMAAIITGDDPRPQRLFLAGAAALCFYCFGLILNDLHDFETDRLHRPNRPLPRHEIPIPLALLAAILFLVAGMALSWFLSASALLVGSVLAFLVVTYNFHTKNYAVLGGVNMGLCRGVSFMLGVPHTCWQALPLAAAFGVTAYIAAVTALARHEDVNHRHGYRAWRPLWVLLAMMPALVVLSYASVPPLRLILLALLLAAVLLAVGGVCRRLAVGEAPPERTRSAIGEFIRTLILIQAPFLFLLPDTAPFGLALLLGYPVSKYLGRSYAGS